MSLKIGRNDPCWCGSGKKYKKCHEAFDEKMEIMKQKGYAVIDHDLIKTPEQIAKIKESCKINIAVLDYVEEHISDRSPWFHLGNTNLNTFFCDLDKFFFLRTHFTDAEHSGRVRIITIIYCRYINIDNISLFQNLLFIRDSMAYHFIYRSTHALWKSFVI